MSQQKPPFLYRPVNKRSASRQRLRPRNLPPPPTDQIPATDQVSPSDQVISQTHVDAHSADATPIPDETPAVPTVVTRTATVADGDHIFALIALLREDLKATREMMTSQLDRIHRLEQRQNESDIWMAREANILLPATTVAGASKHSKSIPEAPQLQSFSGNMQDQTSTKVKSFIYSVQKVGALSGMSEQDMLALADCYLTDGAAMWMMNLESTGCKPTSIEGLQSRLIAEFVPADEKIRAKSKMMHAKMNRGIDHYISVFRDLNEIAETPLAMAYAFFFMGLPDYYKEEMTKQFPDMEPESMQEVYDSARMIERAQQFTRKRSL